MSDAGLNAGFIKSLPAILLESIPAGSPPPGAEPNFAHPQTLFPVIITLLAIFLSFALSFYVVRVYMKAIFLKKWRWDDTMITLGFIFTLVYISAIISGTGFGSVGVHLWEIHVERVISLPSLYSLYVFVTAVTPALGFIKLGFLMQFYYLFKPLRWIRISCWIGGSLIAFIYGSISIIGFILNSPWPGEDLLGGILSWHYLAFTNLSVPTGVFSLVTDLFLLVLPIPAVLGLQMPLRKKLGVLIVFALGVLAVIASSISLYYRVQLFQNAHSTEVDPGWVAGYIAIWTELELLSGIIAANMPVVHQFFVRKNVLERIFGSKLSTTIKSLLHSSRGSKRGEKSNEYSLDNTFGSKRKGERIVDVESNASSSNNNYDSAEWQQRNHQRKSSQIMVSTDYTVERHVL